jgi:CBS domain-containing protein
VVEAARLVEAQHVKRLLVVDEADRLLGIVRRGDLLRIFLRRGVDGVVSVAGHIDHRTDDAGCSPSTS